MNTIIDSAISEPFQSTLSDVNESLSITEKDINMQTITTENTLSTRKPPKRITLVDIVTSTMPITVTSNTPNDIDITTSKNTIDEEDFVDDRSTQTPQPTTATSGIKCKCEYFSSF